MPNLEILHLCGVKRVVGTGSSNTAALIPLERIRSISCTSSLVQEAFKILKYLLLPEQIFVRIDYNPRLDDDDLCVDNGHLELPGLALLHGVTALEISKQDDALRLIAEGTSSGLWIQGNMVHDEDGWTSWLSKLPSRLPFHNIPYFRTHLSSNSTSCRAEVLPFLLRHLTRFTDMQVTINQFDDVAGQHVAPVQCLCAALSGVPILCPELTSLTIYTLMDKACYLSSARFIAGMLSARAGKKHPLPKLTIGLAYRLPTRSYMTTSVNKHPLGDDSAGAFSSLSSLVEDYTFSVLGSTYDGAYKVRDAWTDPAAETYWELEEDDKPPRVAP